ncbi:hypothetical protein SAMN04489760_104115 [Syntrophus gentianae]|uniref:Uncharacterized protein n=1 Tax=Syntrophus gentianae TaxID=43775 RepID=A0A1H7VPW8_9BACT|nr:hypothetical protein [Syntrophus gentianae]SEM11301.1 hypothetical protein SAMN04489760_104115 [Syntrophus gentianae]
MTTVQALVRFVIIMAIGWFFMYLVPPAWFFMSYVPFSFLLLMGLVTFGVCGLGWPFAAPGGFLFKPGMNRAIPGVLMLVVWLALAFFLNWVLGNVWPKMPMTPWFGIIVFMVTLWYTFDGVGPHPFKAFWANWLFAVVLVMVLALIIWFFAVDLKGTPAEGAPFNPHGMFPGDWWLGYCIWVIVWIQVFGAPMCFQGWPFYKMPKGVYPVALTVACFVLGYVCWEGSLALGLSPTFSSSAIGASMIGWSLMHSVAFEMAPFAKYIQPKRGVLCFILEEIVVTAIWICLLLVILKPIAAKSAAAGLPFDIYQVSAFYTLHVVAVILLIHQFFFMRAPLSIPGPPLGPEQLPGE